MEDFKAQEKEEIKKIIKKNLDEIKKGIERACTKTGKNPEDIILVAVTKTVPSYVAKILMDLGQNDLGESRVQVLEKKASVLGSNPPTWHFIGPLQRNKARKCVKIAEYIHSVESERLLIYLDRVAGEEGKKPKIFLEVNTSGEAQKHGISPEGLPYLLDKAREAENLELIGLMTIAPFTDNEDEIRKSFVKLRKLMEEYCPDLLHLSMGMTNDYEIAIEEGATIIRIGTGIFKGLKISDEEE